MSRSSLPPSQSSSNTELDDLLSALTDALLTDGEIDQLADELLAHTNAPRREVEGLVHVLQRLHGALLVVQPSHRFTRRLKQDILGVPEENVVMRFRQLPTRVQLATGIALLAGFLFVRRRRAVDDDALRDTKEVTALLQ
ncbi:MAG: hypothetical protein H7175_24350 [Burkholderiales bacterium]|nr:hypothetical protein [Anaerolineae bacterium]